MKILIVAMNYAPEVSGTAPYTSKMAESLASEHEVHVLAGVPHYPEWRIHEGFGAWRAESVEKSVRVARLRHVVPSKPNALTRLAHEISFCLRALVESRRERPDVVVAISPPLFGAVAAKLIAKRKRVPLGVVVQDIYSAGVAELGQAGGRVTAAAAWLLSRLDATVDYEEVAATARRLGETGHIKLTEVFAERLARELLDHPQVRMARVKVDKPDALAPAADAAGAEIVLAKG